MPKKARATKPNVSRLETLSELVRQGERVIDAQLRTSEEHDDKTEHNISIAILLFAGTAGLAGLLADQSPPALPMQPFGVLLLGAFVHAAIAVGNYAQVYAGLGRFKSAYRVGWDADMLRAVAVNKTYTGEDVHLGTLAGIKKWVAFNKATLEGSTRRRTRGTVFLLGAAFLVAIAFLYVLAGYVL